MNMSTIAPNITVGFHPGAAEILTNFTGDFVSLSQKATMRPVQDRDCCFGSIEQIYKQPTITMFGAKAEDVREASFFIDAVCTTKVKGVSIKARRKDGTTTVTITYNPAITGHQWRSIYGTILKKIWLAGIASQAIESPAALTMPLAWAH
jgi:hypothetical protein